jgi:two-component system chemotaxis response regulator CheB
MANNRDVVVVGASAGGLDAVASVLAQLPPDLPAAVCVVVHVPQDASGQHVRLLDRASTLPVRKAEDIAPLYHGNVYVAPPDRHLVLGAGHLRVSRGPKENRARPAIDPLFRSAADVYGERVIGLLLTGYLDDGVAGLAEIGRSGGMTLVQDPGDAIAPEMPSAAIARLEVDHVAPVHRMGALLTEMVGGGADVRPPGAHGESLAAERGGAGGHGTGEPGIETRIAAGEEVEMEEQEDLGEMAGFGCPECGGPLLEIPDPSIKRYRCHIGHAYTQRALLSEQSDQVERALTAALRTLEERARLMEDLARAQGDRDGETENLYRRADEARGHAQTIRELVLSGGREESAA